MRAAEQALIDGGETVSSLMERAGKGAAQWVWRVSAGRPVTVLCGPGNNGGDGYVIAHELQARGAEVQVVAPFEPTSDAAIAARKSYGGKIVKDAAGGVLVDCLFGSGLTRPLDAELVALISRLAQAHHSIIAVDLPSGIEGDTGAVLNAGLPACNLTLALGAWKRAHWLMPAMTQMGELRLVDIGIGPVPGAARLISKPKLSAPAADAHKYTRGLLVVIGGEMPGAAVLAASAAMHSGAGYVKLATEHKTSDVPADLVVGDAPVEDVLADDRIDAVLIGPGSRYAGEVEKSLNRLIENAVPTVLDAGALTFLEPDMLFGRSSPLVLTPHEGELSHLCKRFGISEGGRVERALALARATAAVVIAKGPDTVIAGPHGELRFCPPSPSWLSTAGTGDVLAGIVASRLATGSDPLTAAEEAVWLHGEAARNAGVAFSASDLVRAVPTAYRRCL